MFSLSIISNCEIHYLILQDKSTFTVHHFQLLDWPDFGVPECTTQFLSFLKYVRDRDVLSSDKDYGPAVVHCSAGIGRSGTFCLVDSALKLVTNYFINLCLVRVDNPSQVCGETTLCLLRKVFAM